MARRSKYNAKATMIDGIRFDSRAEGGRYQELRLLERSGQIEALRVHPVYIVWEGYDHNKKRHERIKYEADFEYIENQKTVIEDVKGVKTDVFRMKAKMFRCLYPMVDFRIIEG